VNPRRPRPSPFAAPAADTTATAHLEYPVTRRQRVEDLTTFAIPEQPALSPDGRTVVYVLTTVDAAADTDVRSLWRATAPAGEARQTDAGKGGLRTGLVSRRDRDRVPAGRRRGRADLDPAG
jgi:hypothetical protein